MSVLGLPNPRWAKVSTLDELLAFGDEIGWPVVLKTPRGGYDGKGVLVLDSPEEARERSTAWFEQLPSRIDFSALLAEEKVPLPVNSPRWWLAVKAAKCAPGRSLRPFR